MKTRILLINFDEKVKQKIEELAIDVDLGYISGAQYMIDHDGSQEETAHFYSPLAIYEYKAVFVKLLKNDKQPKEATKNIGEKEKINFLKYWYENRGIITLFVEDCNFGSLDVFGIPQVDLTPSSGNDKTVFFPLDAKDYPLRNALKELESLVVTPPHKYLKVKPTESKGTEKKWTIFPAYKNRNDEEIGVFLNWGYSFSDTDSPAFLVLPAFSDYKEVIIKLLKVFGRIDPNYFSEISDKEWSKSDKYFPGQISLVEEEIKKVKTNAEHEIQQLKSQKLQLKQKYSYILELLTESGDKLKQSVIKTLTEVFKLEVEDMDKNKKNNFKEDILIKGLFPEPVLTEVKGTKNSYPSFTYITQVFSNLLKARGEYPTAIGGLILNYDREKEPGERSQAYTNSDEQKQLNEIFYLDTRVLFNLSKAIIDHNMPLNEAKAVLAHTGRVEFSLSQYLKTKN